MIQQIRQVTEEDKKQAVKEFAQRMLEDRRRNEELATLAKPALTRLVEVCRHKTGQGYKLRALLFSLWNGKPASLLEIIALDRAIREDLVAVLRAFGSDQFFYKEIKAAFGDAGLFEWFIEEGDVQS